MRAYADTNFFTNLFLKLSHHEEARALYDRRGAQPEELIPITPLLEMEFLNALERYVFESRKGGQWRVNPEGAMVAAALFEDAIQARADFEQRPLGLPAIKGLFERIVHRHTATYGFRTYDILHVASALALGCDTFWTFDAKARKLAKLEGLATN